MKHLSKLGISAGLAVVAAFTLAALLGTSASAGEDGTAGTVPVDTTFDVCRPIGDGNYEFLADVTEVLEGDLVDGVDGTFASQDDCPVPEPPPPPDGDGDGVADEADKCPEAGFTTDADGDGCEDPPADTGDGSDGGDGSGDPPANDPPANDPPANDPPVDDGLTNTGNDGQIATVTSEGDVVIQQTCEPGDDRATCVPGNPTCVGVFGPGVQTLDYQPVVDGSETSGALTVNINVKNFGDAGYPFSEDLGPVFDYTSSGATIVGVIVKGGPNANVYDTGAAGNNLHAPVNPENEKFFGLSHLLFCFTEEEPEDATITICKADVPGTTQEFSFTSTIPGGAAFSIFDNTCEDTFTVDPEDSPFTVTETVPMGFALEDIDCGNADVTFQPSGEATFQTGDTTVSIEVQAGDAVICTFTNEETEPETGEITICKQTIPDEDPATSEFGFETDFSDPFTLVDDECEPEEGSFVLDPGTYEVTEVSLPLNGWTLVDIQCSGTDPGNIVFEPSGNTGAEGFAEGDTTVVIDLVAGEHVTCTFFNDEGELGGTGIIEICKEVIEGDLSQFFEFAGDLPIEDLQDGDCDAESGLEAGEYDVSELVPIGWDLVNVVCEAEGESTDSPITNGVEIDLAEGDLVSCTFFNIEEDTPPPPPPGDDDDDDDVSDVGGVRQPRSEVGGVRQPGKPGVGTGDGSYEPFSSFKDPTSAANTWLPALGFMAVMGLAGMAVAHVYRGGR